MKKMVIVFTMFLLTAGLFALDTSRSNTIMIKSPEEQKIVVMFRKPNNEYFYVNTDFLEIKILYSFKGTGSSKENEYNEKVAFYKECATAEEYVNIVFKFLDTLPLYYHFYNMTETQAANDCDKKGGNKNGTYGEAWEVEYKDCTVKGRGDGCYIVIFK